MQTYQVLRIMEKWHLKDIDQGINVIDGGGFRNHLQQQLSKN